MPHHVPHRTIIIGSKFNLKHFMGPNKVISMHDKQNSESVLEKHETGVPLTREAI
jgi:hypothetical protein